MVTSPQEVMIRNNTVINRFTNPEGLGSGFAEGAPDPDFTSIGSLVVDCRAAQGDHFPVWTSDSLAENGEVTSNEGTNRQFIANYNSRYNVIVSSSGHCEYYIITPACYQITIGQHKFTNVWQLLLPLTRKQPFHHIFHFIR